MRRIAIAIVMVSAAVVGGCEARNLDPDAGGSGSLGGLGGAGVGGAGAGGAGAGGAGDFDADSFGGTSQTWRNLAVPARGEATYYFRMQRWANGPYDWPPPAMP